MNISEMHVWFRQYAQQMGMQNVRAILPEQIDLLINTSIIDFVNNIVKANVSVTNDRVITDNSKIGQINALRTLYRVAELPLDYIREKGAADNEIKSTFWFKEKWRNLGRISHSPEELKPGRLMRAFPDYLFIYDFSISYRSAIKGYPTDNEIGITQFHNDDKDVETNYFPVRLIDDAFLADTLNDFVLKPRLRSPIIVTYNNGTFDLYIDKFTKDETNTYKLQNNLVPYILRFSYIAKPKKVQYAADLNGENRDCDLPEYTHVDILKHAVDLYRISISGALSGAQQQNQAQQQETARNNYRNEGMQ